MLEAPHFGPLPNVFADADFEPEPNVTIGTNDIGKSHVLKLGHAVETVKFDLNK